MLKNKVSRKKLYVISIILLSFFSLIILAEIIVQCSNSKDPYKYFDNLAYIREEDSYTCMGKTGKVQDYIETEIVIPSTVNKLPVTKIGKGAFYHCSSITSVTIPESVTEIEKEAFCGCTNLTSITIPESVTSIGGGAFENCHKLIEVWNYSDLQIEKGEGNYGGVAYYAKQVYTTNEASKQTVTSDGYIFYEDGEERYLFGYKGNETALTLPALSPSGNTYDLHSLAFYEDTSLTSIKIPDSVTSIGKHTFDDCYGLTSVTIGSGVTSIGDYAFDDCSSLENVTFEGNSKLTSIGDNVFRDCISLTSIVIPEGVTSIKSFAFYGCTSLESISIPESVTSIGSDAFRECNSIKNVYITNIKAWCEIDFSNNLSQPLHYITTLYLNGAAVTNLNDVSGVTKIKDYAFAGCFSLESIVIPKSVTEIGKYAFDGCISLTSITIPENVTSIENYAFIECYDLVEVWNYSDLPIEKGERNYGCVASYAKQVYTTNEASKQTVTSDGYIFYEDGEETYLLGYKGNETALTLPALSPSGKPCEIYEYAFYGKTSIESIVIPENATSLASYAFAKCSSLASVTFEGNSKLTSIGDNVFWDCISLTSIAIPDSVTSIGSLAFYNCSSLASVTFEENSKLTSIGENVFRDCMSLTSIAIPDSVTSIESSAFYHCSSLTSIVIPKSVTYIGDWAFSGCNSLKKVYYGGKKAEWNEIGIDMYNENLLNAKRYYSK